MRRSLSTHLGLCNAVIDKAFLTMNLHGCGATALQWITAFHRPAQCAQGPRVELWTASKRTVLLCCFAIELQDLACDM